ncbi:hypothetical protein Slala05_82230 [Streptomyces lavendulae subsp. lavendulae]|nr:hypothetical protein Slala05_82230 [Streptomyces lavendulae subsp. lavendulae]
MRTLADGSELPRRPKARAGEVRPFELDNGTMCQARLAKEVWDYERYAGHRVFWEGAALHTHPVTKRSHSRHSPRTSAAEGGGDPYVHGR